MGGDGGGAGAAPQVDEPTNHLDAESVAWLERTLNDFGGTVVAITHDRSLPPPNTKTLAHIQAAHPVAETVRERICTD